MRTFYHVSEKKNLESIMQNGLIPQVGERSKELNEESSVFLFPTKEDMEFALGQWLGEWYDDKEEECGCKVILMSLEINVPDDFPIYNGVVEYENYSLITIPPKYIKYLQD